MTHRIFCFEQVEGVAVANTMKTLQIDYNGIAICPHGGVEQH